MAEEPIERLFGAEKRDLTGSKNPNFRGGEVRPCDRCSAPVSITPSRLRRNKNHFCGSDCRNLFLSETNRGDNSSGWKGGVVSKVCAHCDKEFMILRALHNRGEGKFCSRECSSKSQRRRIAVSCCMCGSEIAAQRYKEGKKRFCSYKCKSAAQIKEKSEKDIAQRRIEARMAAIIGYSLKKIGKAKDGCSWQSLVGYTRAELMGHLESQFEPGMSWDNIGVWHIDHKRPRVSFSYASVDDPQFKECWALENLQPLWAKDNLSKGSRLDWVRPVAA